MSDVDPRGVEGLTPARYRALNTMSKVFRAADEGRLACLARERALAMRADLAAAVRVGPVRAAAQLGYASPSSAAFTELAWITRNTRAGNQVSREHWIGLAFANDTGLVRGGRIYLPFGLRNIEHTSFVRTATRTDINQDDKSLPGR